MRYHRSYFGAKLCAKVYRSQFGLLFSQVSYDKLFNDKPLETNQTHITV